MTEPRDRAAEVAAEILNRIDDETGDHLSDRLDPDADFERWGGYIAAALRAEIEAREEADEDLSGALRQRGQALDEAAKWRARADAAEARLAEAEEIIGGYLSAEVFDEDAPVGMSRALVKIEARARAWRERG